MAFPAKLLNDGEKVVFSTRTHVKALLVPGLVLVVALVAVVVLSMHTHGWFRELIWVVALVVVAVFVVWPVLTWMGTTYTLTNRRVITRAGVLTRTGHDIPLNRVSDVSYERGVLDRMLGCGTLVISDASTKGREPLRDVPDVERLHLLMTDEIFGTSKADDGT